MNEEKLNQPVKMLKAIGDSYRNSHRLLNISEKQTKISNRQFKLSLLLTITSLIVALVSIYPVFTKSSELKKLENLIELQVKQSETIKEQSIYLDSLVNQVKYLEKKIELISKE